MATKSASDAAIMTITADILPDEIGKIIANKTYKYTPVAGDGWYYKLINVITSSQILIRATDNYLQKATTAAGVDTGGSVTSVHADDKVKFLFIHNTGFIEDGTTATANSVYVRTDTTTAVHSSIECVEIGAGEVWFGKFPNTTVADVIAIAGTPNGAGVSSVKVQCVVAAILDDVS